MVAVVAHVVVVCPFRTFRRDALGVIALMIFYALGAEAQRAYACVYHRALGMLRALLVARMLLKEAALLIVGLLLPLGAHFQHPRVVGSLVHAAHLMLGG